MATVCTSPLAGSISLVEASTCLAQRQLQAPAERSCFASNSLPRIHRSLSERGNARGVKRHLSSRTQAAAGIASASTEGDQRPLWLPGLDAPAYLNGSLPGDFGFDPLGLGEEPKSLRWYVQAELIHCRLAMAGVAGILFTDALRVAGVMDVPVWYEAGKTQFAFADTETLVTIQFILFGFVETKRWMDFERPGSQAEEGSFFGLEPLLKGQSNGYPGGPLFNPVGLASDESQPSTLKLKELKNGRLAMMAMLGFFVQAKITGVGPVDNLIAHLKDPFHATIIQTLSNM